MYVSPMIFQKLGDDFQDNVSSIGRLTWTFFKSSRKYRAFLSLGHLEPGHGMTVGRAEMYVLEVSFISSVFDYLKQLRPDMVRLNFWMVVLL